MLCPVLKAIFLIARGSSVEKRNKNKNKNKNRPVEENGESVCKVDFK